MINLRDKKVIITGGSRGIGKACVKMFAEAGCKIVYTYHKKSAQSERMINNYNGSRIAALKADLNSEAEIKEAVKSAVKFLGGIDILVNNGGIWKYGKADKMSLADWEETIRINLTGTFLFTREVLPYMIKKKSGKIINISSTAGQRGEAFHSHYAASKGGMIAYTKSLAAEYGKYNININCVAPGWVFTDMTKKELSGNDLKVILSDIPLNRVASPENIAGAVLFLASELSIHITGEVINVNGGSVLCG